MSRRIARFLTAALLVIAVADGAAPALTVQVCNLSRADARVVSLAEEVAGRIFADAGVEAVWRTMDKPEPQKLTIQINPGRSMRAEWKDALGIAMTDTDSARSFLADAFFGNIEEVAMSRTDEAILLGYVMAHEVGHLLGLPHASRTVMAGGWDARDIPRMKAEQVRFNTMEAAQLRAAVAARGRGR